MMRRAVLFSFAFHTAVLLLAYFGLPAARHETLFSETALSVELVDVAEKSNVPPARQQKKPEPDETPKPKEQARTPEPAEKERPAPATPPPPAAKPEPEKRVVKAPPPPKAEPEPAPKPEPAPAEVASFKPKEKAPAPEPEKPAAKPEPKAERKPEPKAEPKPAQPERPAPKAEEAEMDFASVLRSVETAKQKAPAGEPKKGETATASGTATSTAVSTNYDASLPVTMSEIDMVRRQIEPCWNLPAGARDAPDMRVSIVVDMNVDGTPRGAVIEEQARMQASPAYRVAAESALRAVLNPRCHPFKLPREKYERWKRMTLVFDPKEMFGS
jgi:outer membrane biosynthesis protein TonB